MNITGIDHLELYVEDALQSAQDYCATYAFEIGAEGGPETGMVGQRSVLLRQGDVRLLLTTGLYDDHPAAEYVRRHGDGVAVVAMQVEDVATTFAELVRRGARPLAEPHSYTDAGETVLVADVAGFGDVVHRLVQRGGPNRSFLPGAMQTVEQRFAGEPMLRLIDHLAVCLPAHQVHETSRFYQEVFGFAEIFTERIEVAGQAMNSVVVQSPSGLVTFTLIEPDTTMRAGQIDAFLDSHGGAGVQHIALITNDLVSTVDRLGERGVRFLNTPASYYGTLENRVGALQAPVSELGRLGILVDVDHWGQLLQIFAESTHQRRTLFMEVIQRRGARTFGSGNIKALYEAKERETLSAPLAGEPEADAQPVS